LGKGGSEGRIRRKGLLTGCPSFWRGSLKEKKKNPKGREPKGPGKRKLAKKV